MNHMDELQYKMIIESIEWILNMFSLDAIASLKHFDFVCRLLTALDCRFYWIQESSTRSKGAY